MDNHIYLDRKYLNGISYMLRGFARTTSKEIPSFYHDACNASAQRGDKSRHRAFILDGRDGCWVQCHNCGYSKPFCAFLKEIDSELFGDYLTEKYRLDQPLVEDQEDNLPEWRFFRKEALARGAEYYQGKPCKHCGSTRRYTKWRCCARCQNMKRFDKYQSYESDRQCPRCKSYKRYAKGKLRGKCVYCSRQARPKRTAKTRKRCVNCREEMTSASYDYCQSCRAVHQAMKAMCAVNADYGDKIAAPGSSRPRKNELCEQISPRRSNFSERRVFKSCLKCSPSGSGLVTNGYF